MKNLILLGFLRLSANRTLRGIGRHSQLEQAPRKLRPPLTKGRLLDLEPHALLAHGLKDQMHMRMRLVSV
jgi:hypothetical protein